MTQFIRALAARHPQLRRGHNLLAQLLAASANPFVISINAAALSTKAPGANAGKFLINYVLSEEGQTIIRNLSRVPIRPGIKPTLAKLDRGALKIHYVPADLYRKFADYEKEFRELFWKK